MTTILRKIIKTLTERVTETTFVKDEQETTVVERRSKCTVTNATPHPEVVTGDPAIDAVFSYRIHGASYYDLPINHLVPIDYTEISVEPRDGPHTLKVRFDRVVTSVGAITCVDALGTPVGTPVVTANGTNQLDVNLGTIPDATRVQVSIAGINGSVSVQFAFGVLLGDVDGDMVVSTTDVDAVASFDGIDFGVDSITVPMVRSDVNFDGLIQGQASGADYEAVLANVGASV